MVRFMMIEQFHNENMRMLYERYFFANITMLRLKNLEM